jgi:GST-like protein
MIDLFYWTTPNGHKISMFLEEAEIEYRFIPVNIGLGEQFDTAFLEFGPNNRIPVILDHQPVGGGGPISVFESGAILLYLANKTGKLMPTALSQRVQVTEWLIWQVANLGPMLGQNHHFTGYAAEVIPYAIDRYVSETSRLYAVLNRRLEGREFIVDEYSIADIACYPWIVPHERQKQDLDRFPHLKHWFYRIKDLPSTSRAYANGRKINDQSTMSEEAKKILFGQTETVVRSPSPAKIQ